MFSRLDGCLLLLLWAAPLVGLADIPPFTATYILHQGPVKVGQVELTLKAIDNGQFQFRSVTQPDGLIALLRDDVVTETSTFVFRNGQPHPLRYSYEQTGDEDIRHVQLTFDWQSAKVTNLAKGHSWRMAIPEDAQDKASIQLALMQRLANGAPNLDFPVADGGKLKRYVFERVGEESMEIGERSLETIKMLRRKNKQQPDTTFWCAPDLHYLPVKIVKKKKLGLFSMDLEQVQFHTLQAEAEPD